MNDALIELRENVAQLREHRASQEESLSNLTKDVLELTKAVAELKTTIDRSRGALYVLSAASGGAGILASMVAEYLWARK